MEKKSFTILINANRKTVWDVLWNEEKYPTWTSAFMEGSRVEADKASGSKLWKKGSKIRFLGPGDEGMVSFINENVPEEFMSFKHIGIVTKGKDDFDSEQSREWKGATENYILKSIDDKTELTVDMDISPTYLEYFTNTWPKALEKVKQIAEQ